MTKTVFFATLLLLPAAACPAWWAENEYSFGSGRFRGDSLSVSARVSPSFISGLSAAFYRDGDHDLKKAYVFRAPVTYSAKSLILTLRPFVYPASSGTGSSAGGARLYAMFPLQEATEESALNLTLSGAAARQKTPLLSPSAAAGPETFSETALQAQLEKSFFKQFFFQFSAAGFSRSGTSRNSCPALKPGPDSINPVMDHGELAYMGTFKPVTAFPKWTATAQFARNMAPDYDSYIYAGYSRISLRSTRDSDSVLGGVKLKLGTRSSLDLAYNYYKIHGETGGNYYRLLFQTFFR